MDVLSFSFICCKLLFFLSESSFASDTITSSQSLSDGRTFVSKDGSFELGFFSPGKVPKSNNHRLGWVRHHDKVGFATVTRSGSPQSQAWVPHRRNSFGSPLSKACSSSALLLLGNEPVWKKSGFNSGSGERKWHPGLEPRRLNPDPDPDFAIPTGNLVLTSQNKSVVWSANLSKEVRTPVVLQLLDSGNLVLRGERDGGSETYLWQSLDYPSDTLLPGMKLGWDLKTGLERRITSWKSSDDPSPGDFFWKIERQFYPELVMWKGSRKFYRTGPWNGIIFSASSLRLNLIFKYHFVSNEDELYYTFYLTDKAVISRIVMNQTVSLRQRFIWRKKNQSWELYSNLPKDQCDSYGLCGANGIFIISQSPICQCLEGFLTNSGRFVDWSQGCVRNKPLNYSRRDGFIKFSELKLPDSTSSWDDYTSTDAYIVYLGCNPISWSSKKQHTVARSSTKAEYRSVAATAAELNWVCYLLTDLGVLLSNAPVIYCDNFGATQLCSNPVFHSRMKHVAIDFHFIRDQVQTGALRVAHVSSADQLADALTKPLSRSQFQSLKVKIDLSSRGLS
ncbi:G-type lectin S-receptor-like serine/threonine-protein kinase [Citrus sinensis]|uniref:G-type lectin S-receptor-like serine/threonine-protein kinase n=1 Tax=Citrus sinensis TaxID=2711 RepID=A0ACB8NZ67_CITSI|nr:G-type lectin S-receptor-like serine/threonine-protein kinase [Citrus sinensis]